MNKKLFQVITYLFTIILLLIIVIGCEPISVSVNSKGEVAFARSEGVFFINLKSGALSLLDWNYAQPTVPVIVRWSPDEEHLAFTVKENKDSQNTTVYTINKKGQKKKIYSTSKVITQLEGSTKGSYISLAQAGEDSDMNVADLVLILVKDGMSKIVVQNAGDVHKWLDDNTIAFIKIIKKNPDNSDIFMAELSLYKVDTQEKIVLTKALVGRTGGMDCFPAMNIIAFTAIKTDKEAENFEKNMTTDGYAYVFNIKSNKLMKISENVINFVEFSPDGTKILAKVKEEGYGGKINLAYIDMINKSEKILIKNVTDTVNANSTNVQAYPTWFDENNVLYWRSSNTYGSSGQALQLMSVDISSLKKQNYQVMIDSEVFKLVEQKGGF